MIKYLQTISDNFVSKWFIFFVDVFMVGVTFTFATIIRFDFDLDYIGDDLFKYHLLLVLVLRTIAFAFFNTFSGIIRHTSLEDAVSIFKAISVSTFVLIILSTIPFDRWGNYVNIPFTIILIDFFIVSVALVFSRIIAKKIYERVLNTFKAQKMIIIYGAGHLGQVTKNTLKKDKRLRFNILAFVDDNLQLNGKSVEGVTVLSQEELLEREIPNIQSSPNRNIEIIFAIQNISVIRKNEILDKLLESGVTVKTIPPIRQWMNGELNPNQIRPIKIEDLLERKPIQLNNKYVASFLKNKVVLITGAAGSIGSEIVRQVVKFQPSKILLFDQAESGIYDIETELIRLNNTLDSEILSFVGHINDEKHLRQIFKKYKPSIVFHAAAYKHVPLMEKSPTKAIQVNTLGTILMADIAVSCKVERFVFVSTDKAVKPTNVMGATKRLAEMYVQSLSASQNTTRFITTRFGNVLGSNGSVIPLFKRQIANGGPLTVTDKNVIRFFMTIPEACQLVLEASTMGKGGEIYVFEMGQPVRIYDLAKRMINLSGLEVGKDISIEFTGLRPGEKLFEELLNHNETTIETHHPKILIAKINPADIDTLSKGVEKLRTSLKGSNKEVVKNLKMLVPEFISQNSEYEILDFNKQKTSS